MRASQEFKIGVGINAGYEEGAFNGRKKQMT
jgi:hypothetical protein